MIRVCFWCLVLSSFKGHTVIEELCLADKQGDNIASKFSNWVTRGLIELESARIDINHVVTDAIEQVTPLIRARRHHLGLQLTPDAPVLSH